MIRKAAASGRMLPTLDLRCEENTALRKWNLKLCIECIVELATVSLRKQNS
jgi:hypothetical protein